MSTTLSPTTDTHSAAPADARPAKDVVVYDGQCRFCRRQMEQLKWWDCCNRLDYVSLHDPSVAERWPDLPHDRLMREMCIVDTQGRRHWGAEAFRYLTRRLRRLWWLAPLMHFPGSMLLWRPLYRFISKHRYRLMGKTDECEGGTCSLHGR